MMRMKTSERNKEGTIEKKFEKGLSKRRRQRKKRTWDKKKRRAS